jgi:threonine/homoserine/homoserine lactone efflux protein
MVKFYTENEVEDRETKTFVYGIFYGFLMMTLFIMLGIIANIIIPGKYTLFDAVEIGGVCSLAWLIVIAIINRK